MNISVFRNFLILLGFLPWVGVAMAATNRGVAGASPPVIYSAYVNLDASEVSVVGERFNSFPTPLRVQLGTSEINVIAATDKVVTARLPQPIADGTYLLNIITSQGLATLSITISQSAEASPASSPPAGSTGTAGPAGPAGPRGEKGDKGDKGDKGEPGVAGTIGALGAAGAQGPPGPQGFAGPAGPAGSIGTTGAVGPQGPAGPAGATGAAGPQGAAGSAGVAGPPGATGAQGIPGPAGPAGSIGATGAVGPQGPAGPAGATGAAGPQGAAGSAGVAGPPGAVGAQGIPGAAGPAGAAGPVGPTGATGEQGPAGILSMQFVESDIILGDASKDDTSRGTSLCPDKSVVISGGARTEAADGNWTLLESYPIEKPHSWQVYYKPVDGTAREIAFRVYAVCAILP